MDLSEKIIRFLGICVILGIASIIPITIMDSHRRTVLREGAARMEHALSWLPASKQGEPNWNIARPDQFEKALEEMEDLADDGYLPAQELVAAMHLAGAADAGASRSKCAEWFLRAGNQGSKYAMGYLARGYANGWYGFSRDRAESYKWATLSGDFSEIDTVRFSPNEKTEGQRRALSFVPKREL